MIIMTNVGGSTWPCLPLVCPYVPPFSSRGMCLAMYPLPDVPFVSLWCSPPFNTSNITMVPSHKWSDREVEMIYEASASLLLRFESTSFYLVTPQNDCKFFIRRL